MSTPIQRTFAGGEISPALQSRVDTTKYQTGLKTMRNNIVMGEGGSANRPGFEYIATVPSSTSKVRLVEFEFNDEQTYILEFGHQYMRVLKSGSYTSVLNIAIDGITNANPGVITAAAHGLSNGQLVYISIVEGMTEINNRYYLVANATTNTFTLTDMAGNGIDTTSFGAYTAWGNILKIFQLATPFDEDDLADMQFAQSADVMTIAHRNYPPQELSRLADYDWTIAAAQYMPLGFLVPQGYGASVATVGSNTYYYRVTGFNRDTGEESLPGLWAGLTISSITNASPAVVTLSASTTQIEEGLEVLIVSFGMTEISNLRYVARNVTSTTFELWHKDGTPLDSTSYGAFAAGSAYSTHLRVSGSAAVSNTNYIDVLWTGNTAFTEYNVYRYYLNGWYRVGTIHSSPFRDLGVTPDITNSAPEYEEIFVSDGDYPGVASYLQQSLVLASTDNQPETLWKSSIGNYHKFTPHFPIQSDDPTIFTMAGNKVNQVRHVIDLGKMMILTSSGEWTAEGQDGTVTPTSINLKQYSRYGSAKIRPLIIDGDAIFVQARGSVIRDLAFEWESQGYKGNDLTKFARHMFKGYTVVDWAYQQNPDSIVWVVRSDGKLLALTYVREHQIWGWSQHDTDGTVENVAVVSEGDEDAVYIVVVRTIDGVECRQIERLSQRYFTDIKDAVFMDSAVTYDGRNTDDSVTMTLTGSGWTSADTLTLTCSASFFQASDVGNQIHFTADDGSTIKFNVAAYSSATVVTGTPETTVPAELRAAATSDWARAVDEILGLHHLEGKAVSILADGFVVASPNNSNYAAKTVSGGGITLDECFAVIHIGLPYVSDLVTLEIDTGAGGTYASQKKLTNQLNVRVHESRGIWMGAALPDDDSTDGLYEYKQKYVEDGVVPPLVSETIEAKIAGKWTKPGSIAIRQVDPLPLQILSISPGVTIEEGKA